MQNGRKQNDNYTVTRLNHVNNFQYENKKIKSLKLTFSWIVSSDFCRTIAE